VAAISSASVSFVVASPELMLTTSWALGEDRRCLRQSCPAPPSRADKGALPSTIGKLRTFPLPLSGYASMATASRSSDT
jgi:hypothetical protein